MAQAFLKDPAAVLDYTLDWTDWLAGDAISSHTVTVPAGITLGSSTATATAVTLWLSGGTVGVSYAVVVRVLTLGGRTDERTIMIYVQER